MIQLIARVVWLWTFLVLLIKSQSINTLMLPKQEISTTETESNTVYMWSTTSSPEIMQTFPTVQTVATRPPIASDLYFSGMSL